MTRTQIVVTVLAVVVGTMLTRFLPFVLFRTGEKTPKYIKYLGKALPSAVFGMLVVYCLKGVDVFGPAHGIPELISVTFTVLLHVLMRRTLISIAGGTVCYMLLVQLVF